jgi:hypothetical protein
VGLTAGSRRTLAPVTQRERQPARIIDEKVRVAASDVANGAGLDDLVQCHQQRRVKSATGLGLAEQGGDVVNLTRHRREERSDRAVVVLAFGDQVERASVSEELGDVELGLVVGKQHRLHELRVGHECQRPREHHLDGRGRSLRLAAQLAELECPLDCACLGEDVFGVFGPGERLRDDLPHVTTDESRGMEQAAQVAAGFAAPERGVLGFIQADRDREPVGAADRDRLVFAAVDGVQAKGGTRVTGRGSSLHLLTESDWYQLRLEATRRAAMTA